MKKRNLKSLDLNKTSISNLEDSLKGGAFVNNSLIGCANTGCIGPVRHTCGIINCDLMNDVLYAADAIM